MLYICTTTTKCEILEKNANCKVTLKKLWCRLLRSNSELAWKVKVKQEEKKFENCFGRPRLVDIQHLISLSQSGAIVIILNIGFPWAMPSTFQPQQPK